MRWAKDLWRHKQRKGRLKVTDRRWLESEGDKVGGLVWDLFGGGMRDMADRGTEVHVVSPYGEEIVMEWVHQALAGTKNNSVVIPDGVGYGLIGAVRGTRLGREVLGEVVAGLWGGYMPDRWRDMRVVLISKPGRDLTQTKNWRPLKVINCVGKLGEKVVGDRILAEWQQILHHQQYSLVRGRSIVDVLYKSVVSARECFKNKGSVGWAFWEVKGGF